MAAASGLRGDYTADDVRRLAKASRDAGQTRRLLALAVIYAGALRRDAARIGGVGLQTVRFEGSGNCPVDSFPDKRVLCFNARGPAGLVDRKAPGKTPLMSDEQRAALARAVEAGPEPYLDWVVRWRLADLAQWLWDELGVSVSRQTLGRELRAMGFRKLSARPRHHAQDPEAIDAFKSLSPAPDRAGGRL